MRDCLKLTTKRNSFNVVYRVSHFFSAEEPSDNTAIIAGSIGGGLVLLGLLAALLKYLVAVCTNKAQTVQPMPSKPTPWALTETGKRSNMTNSTIPSPPNATLLPGQIHVHDPEILPGTKTNPYATAVTVEP